MRHAPPALAFTARLTPPSVLLVSQRGRLRERIRAELAAGARRVVIDLATTTYIDSSALGMLIQEKRRAVEAGADLVLENVPDDLAEMFALTKLDQVFAPVGPKDHDGAHPGAQRLTGEDDRARTDAVFAKLNPEE